MFQLQLLIFTTILSLGLCKVPNTRLHKYAGLDIFELATAHGYPLQRFEVTTEDGYIVTIHRIPYGTGPPPHSQPLQNKPAVLIMHGLLSCSADFINIGPEQSLAYKLVELGYDVWLGNARGNAESRKHQNLDPDKDSKQFWSFSWQEIAQYDLPAMIDHILNVTGNSQLQYVGYSQGTTAFMAMASTLLEYNSKIKLATLLAPSAEMNNIKSPIFRLLAPFEEKLTKMSEISDVREILPRSKLLYNFAKTFCASPGLTQEFCKLILYVIGGYNPLQMNGDFIPVIATNTPAGASFKQIGHYLQVINAKEFRMYDYHNETLNMEKYGSVIPPKFDLSKVTAPVALYYSKGDILASYIDAKKLVSMLGNVQHAEQVDYEAFTHLDFLWAINVDTILYENVIKVMQKFNH